MDAFGIEEGVCGSGTGRYAAGLITLPDGTARGVETVTRLEIHPEPRSAAAAGQGLQRATRTTSAVAGSFREALGTTKVASPFLPLPFRLAVSTVRAGLGAIEEGFRPREAVVVAIHFADGTTLTALMPPETVALIRRDAEVARGALERAGRLPALPAPVPDMAPDEALTSIFRYEKRNGRLRRVAASGKPED